MRMPLNPGATAAGFFREILIFLKKPHVSWICMKGFGRINPWAIEITSSLLMKKPVSRLENENIIL